ncbi:MAG: ATP-binding protein [Actinomycetota bacterium]|nr:ATP-binding protein [Actinomycetota bacterium]
MANVTKKMSDDRPSSITGPAPYSARKIVLGDIGWRIRRLRRRVTGFVVGLVLVVAFAAMLVPLRAHVNVSTITLVFIIPAITAEVTGGVLAGLTTVALSALALDFYFIPPYDTLSIGSAQNWVGLGVYLVVVGLVAVVIAQFRVAHARAERNALSMRRVFELSELLVQDRTEEDLLVSIVGAVRNVFAIDAVTLFVLDEGQLKVAASEGPTLTEAERNQLGPPPGHPVSMSTALGSTGELRTVSLAASGRPIGLLVLKGTRFVDDDHEMLITFANDAAIAIERAQLREQALRTTLLEEVDRLRHSLMGAVSHDLRTPLATIKVASSTLVTRARQLTPEDAHELHQLIEIESDRLTRLVANLLDMTRIQAGVLEIHQSDCDVRELIDESVLLMGAGLRGSRLNIDAPADLPPVHIDHLLVTQVLLNLLDNALRHSPDDGLITICARRDALRVHVSVDDEGPGVAPGDRQAIFDRFVKFDTGGRAGLGLTIVKTFIEAHGEHVWYEEAPGGGARFVFSLPSTNDSQEAH